MFSLFKILGGRIMSPEPMLLPATTGEVYKMGEALKLASGAATKCSGTTAPTYICTKAFTAAAGDKVPCYKISKDMLFEVELSEATNIATAGVVGGVLTVDSDGLKVTTTAANGVATVVDMQSAAAAGDKIIVCF